MNPAKKMIYEAFAVGILIALIFASISIFQRSIELTDKISEEQTDTSQTIEEYPVMKFDGYEISGSQVIYYVKDVVGSFEIPVIVKTSKMPDGFSVTDSRHYSDFRDINSAYYINPVVQYSVSVSRDENGVIDLVEITYVTP